MSVGVDADHDAARAQVGHLRRADHVSDSCVGKSGARQSAVSGSRRLLCRAHSSAIAGGHGHAVGATIATVAKA
jgi:hypothetical protein